MTLPEVRKKAYKATDVGNGERFVDQHGADVRWVTRWKTFLVWDGRRWARDESCEVERRAKATIRTALEAVVRDSTADNRAMWLAHLVKSESSGKIRAMIEMARSEPGMIVDYADLDQQLMQLTVRNGAIDLASGKLGPHQRSHYSTKLVDIDYDPTAGCPTWLKTLDVVFGGDMSLIAYLQRAIGYSLTGDTREQVLHLCHGTGANGKSTILDVLAALTGDYGSSADFSTFLERRNDSGPRDDVARLAGARLVRSSEVGENKRLNEGLIKSLTGGDIICARFLYSENFEFKPQFKLWLAANHKPVIRGTDYAIWRRIQLIPFEVTIAPEQRDEGLPAKLRAELPGILAWAVEGCQMWLAEGLRPPARVEAATDAYKAESDSMATFIEEVCEVNPTFESSSGDLYKAFKQWADTNGEYVMSNQMFGRRLSERGYEQRKTGGLIRRRGIRLRSADAPSVQQEAEWY